MKSCGAKFEPSGDFDDSESETASQPDVQMDEDAAPPSQRFNLEETKPKLIIDKGTSRYFDRYVDNTFGCEVMASKVC